VGHVSADLQANYRPQISAEDVVLSGWFGSMGIGRHHQASDAQRQRALELLRRMGLAGLEQRRFGELSDGQRRRLLLARALVHQPELLVLDEPTNGLDPQARHLLLGILRQLANGGTTLLLVTHQLEAVIPEVSRAVLLKEGRIAGDGSAQELLRAEPLSRLFDTPLQVVERGGLAAAPTGLTPPP
jgi:iron complex transport system ATP-binding protein